MLFCKDKSGKLRKIAYGRNYLENMEMVQDQARIRKLLRAEGIIVQGVVLTQIK